MHRKRLTAELRGDIGYEKWFPACERATQRYVMVINVLKTCDVHCWGKNTKCD